MVRRWRLIVYFPILYNPSSPQFHPFPPLIPFLHLHYPRACLHTLPLAATLLMNVNSARASPRNLLLMPEPSGSSGFFSSSLSVASAALSASFCFCVWWKLSLRSSSPSSESFYESSKISIASAWRCRHVFSALALDCVHHTAERRHTGRERMGSPTLQTLQNPILPTPCVCFRAGGSPNPFGFTRRRVPGLG
jgi:hypothetical protein